MVTFFLLILFFYIWAIPSGPQHKKCGSYATGKGGDKDYYCFRCKKFFDIKTQSMIQSKNETDNSDNQTPKE